MGTTMSIPSANRPVDSGSADVSVSFVKSFFFMEGVFVFFAIFSFIQGEYKNGSEAE